LAQVVRLSHPWDTLGHVLASASADPSSHTVQAPLGATTPLTPLPDQPGERLAQQLSPPQQAQPQQPLEQTSHDHLLPGATLRPSQQPQQPQLQHSKHSARSKPSSSSPFGLAGVIPPGQLHAITQAQLRKLQPQFIRQSELSACSSMGQRLSRSLLKEQQVVVWGRGVLFSDAPHLLCTCQHCPHDAGHMIRYLIFECGNVALHQ